MARWAVSATSLVVIGMVKRWNMSIALSKFLPELKGYRRPGLPFYPRFNVQGAADSHINIYKVGGLSSYCQQRI